MFKSHPILASFATLGALSAANKTCDVIKCVWRYVLRPSKNLTKTYKTEGSWAIITGGSSGIGLAYAKLLARAGFKLILIARNPENLGLKRQEIIDELGSKAPEIYTFPFDFSQPYDKEYYSQLNQLTSDKEIAILVNNVGTDHACEFSEFTTDVLTSMLNVNINALTFLSHIVIPKMAKRSKRSAIINISSTFTTAFMPYFNLYIATKSYMNSLMECLHKELKGKNIDVLTCLTGEVSTPRNKMKSIWHTTPHAVAEGHLSALGYDSITAGTVRHAFYGLYLRSCISCWFKNWLGKTAREETLKEAMPTY